MLKLRDGFEEYVGLDGTFLAPTGCNRREALVFVWHPGKEPRGGRVHAFPCGEWSYKGFETEQEAHEYLLRMGSGSPWEVVSDSPDLRAVLTRIIEARDIGTVAALIEEIDSARRILRGESC
jgi:hypothetical protein